MKIKLLILLLLSCLTTQADNVVIDGIKYSFNLNKLTAEVTGYDKELSGDVNILSEIKITKVIREYKCKVTSIGASAFDNFTGMTSITIPKSVTNIGWYAFSGCSGLTSVAIPGSVTNIGEHVFSGCINLNEINVDTDNTMYASIDGVLYNKSITTLICCPRGKNEVSFLIPNSVTSIGGYAFGGCETLSSIKIPSTVTSVSATAFSGCVGIKELIIENSDMLLHFGKNTLYGKAFRDCPIEKLYVGRNFDWQGDNPFDGKESLKSVVIDYMSYIGSKMFYGCPNLTNVVIGESVTSIGHQAFSGCESLPSVDLKSVTSIGVEAFYNCKSLTSVDMKSVTNIAGSAFSGCTSLTAINFPNSMTEIGEWAFHNCSALASVSIPNSLKKVRASTFSGCNGLTDLKIEDGKIELSFSISDGNTYDKEPFQDCPIEKLYIGRKLTNYTYFNKKTLTDVTIDGFSDKVMSGMFEGCSNLENVAIGNSVTSIGEKAFSGCSNLKSINIPAGVTSINEFTFAGCSNLPAINIPNGITFIGKSAFSGCSNLNTINIPERITNIEEFTFNDCRNLVSINIPNCVTNIDNSAFFGCSSLKSITLPNTITCIRNSVFYGCSGLTSIVIPNSVKLFDDSAFRNCSSLQSINIPNGVTSIGESVFSGCSSLKSVDIPSSVKAIGENSFSGCSLIINIYGLPSSLKSFGLENSSTIYARSSLIEYVKSKAYSGTVLPIEPYLIETENYICALSAKLKKNEQSPIIMEKPVIYAKYNGNPVELTKDENGNYIASGLTPNTQYSFYYNVNSDYGNWNYINSVWTKQCDVNFSKNEITQTSISFTVNAPKADKSCVRGDVGIIYNNKEYKCNENKVTISGLKANAEHKFYAYAYYNDNKVETAGYKTFKTLGFGTSVNATITPTTLQCITNRDMGTAQLKSEELTVNGTVYTESPLTITGLTPNASYAIKYTVYSEDGGEETYTKTLYTPSLELTTLQPKCVSSTCAIVAASTNISDDETNVGFQWKKYDAPESLAPSEGYAAIYGGQIEGYLKNLQPTSFYNVRAFYKSAVGKYYYGDWITFDPSDFSYFEPTVHTYEATNVTYNSAKMKGYVLAGTDAIEEQGFEYWPTSGSNAKPMRVRADVGEDVSKVLATGQVMTVTLTDLKASTAYSCRAFVTTATGTTYGEVQTFTTQEDLTGIGNVVTTETVPTVIGYYNMRGQKYDAPQRGVNIVRYSDGTVKKIYVK